MRDPHNPLGLWRELPDEVPHHIARLRTGHPILYRPKTSMAGAVLMIDPLQHTPRVGEAVLVWRGGQQVTLQRVHSVRGGRVWFWSSDIALEGPLPLDVVAGVARLQAYSTWSHVKMVAHRFIALVGNFLRRLMLEGR